MMPRDDKHASKFLSLVLRHKPETIGIELDDNGYVSVDILLIALQDHGWSSFSRKDLNRIVENNDKKRFAYSEDGELIRASQGHSVNVDLELKPVVPPKNLFHGTVDKFLDSIKKEGLKKGSRQHVHLSQDHKTATSVGSRRGKPIILTINAEEMHQAGYSFYLSANGVWLADEVPVKYIEFPK